ncbi:hypothetical protein L6452_33682 [Arctium lappa]|uniref:Uncharacterized protein n=1 Tax=Arctium lappa TaxID=4217 RepID=A0ACB8YGP8_ARCLA|nr:hypothetical protein L6452_33682 [Arctium lappa]
MEMEMKRLVLFSVGLLLLLGFAQSIDITEADLKSDETKMALYDRWRAEYKIPDPSPQEKTKRFKAFKMNLDRVESRNAAKLPYKLKLNKFADLTNDEFKLLYTGTHSRHGRTLMSQGGAPADNAAKTQPPPAVDWRTQNAVTPVRDQGQCGGTCNKEKAANKAVKIDGYKDVPMENAAALMKAVANQPVVACIDTSTEFQLYSEGIFSGECGRELSHGLVVVGYDDAQKFWILKNSWGEDWGEGGYIRLQKDAPDPWGMCGILLEASYPIIKDGNQPPKEEF